MNEYPSTLKNSEVIIRNLLSKAKQGLINSLLEFLLALSLENHSDHLLRGDGKSQLF